MQHTWTLILQSLLVVTVVLVVVELLFLVVVVVELMVVVDDEFVLSIDLVKDNLPTVSLVTLKSFTFFS